MSNTSLRIHPAIGMARVGNSDEYYLGPESLAGMPNPQHPKGLRGGLPINKDTGEEIDSSDIRDTEGKLKKQAARFKIYQYDQNTCNYPYEGKSSEVTIGSKVDGKMVKDIIWTVHLANKKANCWGINDDFGIDVYKTTPPSEKLRNASFGANPANEDRLKKLVIDAGPQAIKGTDTGSKTFEKGITPTYAQNDGTIVNATDYPTNYPASDIIGVLPDMPSQPIQYIGAVSTDSEGRLIVTGGHGLACSFDDKGNYKPVPKDGSNKEYLSHDVDNDNWLDDTSDGPVTAILVFEDNSTRQLESTAWAVITDPSYAPQTPNINSLWDEIFNSWVMHPDTNLIPSLYNGKYNADYQPYFHDEIHPIFNAAHLQMWNTALNKNAFIGHKMVANLGQADNTKVKIMQYIRIPASMQPGVKEADRETSEGSPKMPLALGDAGQAFLTVTETQYQFIQQWQDGKSLPGNLSLQPGEFLDKAILFNCLGGRFSPGIDMTFIIRDVNLYNVADWHNTNIGPFRINAKTYDYSTISKNKMAIGVGYVPLHDAKVEPGDICKFMAIPWHTDYNSCATHLPYPNPGSKGVSLTNEEVYSGQAANKELYWSWPAQRPVSVYTYDDLKKKNGNFFTTDEGIYANTIPAMDQRFSLRGDGTSASGIHPTKVPTDSFENSMMQVGRYQQKIGILLNWQRIGIIMQSAAIKDFPYDNKDIYLEVGSQFKQDLSNAVDEWPTLADDTAEPPNN